MEASLQMLWFVASLTLLVASAKWFVKGAETLGYRLGMTPFTIGATIVGIGTSLPELTSSIAAVVKGEPEIVAANVVGSNIGNIFLILGVAAVAAGNLPLNRASSKTELALLIYSTVFLIIFMLDQSVSPWEGAILVTFFVIYTIFKLTTEEDNPKSDVIGNRGPVWRTITLIGISIVGLYFGSQRLECRSLLWQPPCLRRRGGPGVYPCGTA